jgi:small subunit ribosomal protein S23e
MGVGKPRGIRAARKLKDHRKNQKWWDNDYNKRMIGSRWKNPFQGTSHAKGLVTEKIGVTSKQVMIGLFIICSFFL